MPNFAITLRLTDTYDVLKSFYKIKFLLWRNSLTDTYDVLKFFIINSFVVNCTCLTDTYDVLKLVTKIIMSFVDYV